MKATVSYHDTVNEVQAHSYWGNGPFSRHGWFELLEKGGHPALFATTGKACLPLERAKGGLRSLSNWYAFTWTPLANGDAEGMDWKQLAADLSSKASRIELEKVPEEEGCHIMLADAFASAGWFVWAEPGDTNHFLRLRGRSYAEYLASRPGPLRTTLKRKAKKVDVHLTDRFDADDWAAYEDIYADSWKPEEGDPDMLRAFAQGESEAGRYRFALARHDGEAVAAQFWTIDGETAFIHKLAHRKNARNLSPGTVLTAALMRRVIDDDGATMVDFGTGDDAYKRDWMEEVRTRWNITCLRPGDPRNWPAIARQHARKLVSAFTRG